MKKIWILTSDESLALPLQAEFRQVIDCQVFIVPDFEYSQGDDNLSPPDVLVVDLQTVSLQTGNLLKYRSIDHSDIPHFALVPKKQSAAMEDNWQFGFDEFITRPTNQRQALQVVASLRQSLETLERIIQLKKELLLKMRESHIVAWSKPMRDILNILPRLAESQSTVLINGETGTGKELFARAIHYLGSRSGRPFMTLDCGALPENLVENELFGHVQGAYTDAGPHSKGLIKEAHGGTLFLDEVEAMPISIQPKFLRFLQDRQYKPLGQASYISSDVRVVAATNNDLLEAVRQKTFRKDLYYRLNVLLLSIPPLRDRKSDIPALVYHFLHKYTKNSHTKLEILEDTMRSWLAYDWPGNVRELENEVQKWMFLGCSEVMNSAQNVDQTTSGSGPFVEARKEALTRYDRLYLQNLLLHTKGNISEASRLAKVDRKNLRRLLKKYNLDKDQFSL